MNHCRDDLELSILEAKFEEGQTVVNECERHFVVTDVNVDAGEGPKVPPHLGGL